MVVNVDLLLEFIDVDLFALAGWLLLLLFALVFVVVVIVVGGGGRIWLAGGNCFQAGLGLERGQLMLGVRLGVGQLVLGAGTGAPRHVGLVLVCGCW